MGTDTWVTQHRKTYELNLVCRDCSENYLTMDLKNMLVAIQVSQPPTVSGISWRSGSGSGSGTKNGYVKKTLEPIQCETNIPLGRWTAIQSDSEEKIWIVLVVPHQMLIPLRDISTGILHPSYISRITDSPYQQRWGPSNNKPHWKWQNHHFHQKQQQKSMHNYLTWKITCDHSERNSLFPRRQT